MFDGGIRSGQDIMRALALGARSCLIGRAYIYGLGALGEHGVARAIHFLRKELDVTMALCWRQQRGRDRPASDRVGRDRLKV
jgi:L-lactate dehydrogenase (cytochrome)